MSDAPLFIIKMTHPTHGVIYAHSCVKECKGHPRDAPTVHMDAAMKVEKPVAEKAHKVWEAFWKKNEPEVQVTIEESKC
jgi:hypothetical protein